MATAGALRLSVSYGGKPQAHRSIFLADSTDQPPVSAKVVHEGKLVGVATADGELLIDPANGDWTLHDGKGGIIIPLSKIGEVPKTDMQSPRVVIDVEWQKGKSPAFYGSGNGAVSLLETQGLSRVGNGVAVVPRYWSDSGYAVLAVGADDNAPASWRISDEQDHLTWRFPGSSADLYLMPAATLYDAAAAYAQLSGPPAVPPRWTFGYLQCRWGWKDRAYIEDTLKQFSDRKLPVDAFIFDFEWYTDEPDYKLTPVGATNFVDFGWNPLLFPEPAAQLTNYQAQGVRVVGIRKPRLGNSETLKMIRAKGWENGTTLRGGGTITLGTNGNNVIQGAHVFDVMTNLDNTIQGAGRIGLYSGGNNGGLRNFGTIIANQSSDLIIQPYYTVRFVNSGTLQINAGSVLKVLDTASGLSFSNFVGATATLTGGTYIVSGTFQFDKANISNNAANIILDGPSSVIQSQAAHNALANFVTNTAAGGFTLQNGRVFSTAGPFVNLGTIQSLGGATFGNFTNLINGTFDCAALPIINVNAGDLYVTNSTASALLEVRSGTITMMNASVVRIDKLVITNSCGRFIKVDGVLSIGTTNLGAGLSAVGDNNPNGWKQQYHLDPFDPNLANEDPDGDGMNNLQEFLAAPIRRIAHRHCGLLQSCVPVTMSA